MIRKWFGLSIGYFVACVSGFAQQGTVEVEFPSDSDYNIYEYNLNLPIGQAFINCSDKPGITRVRSFRPGVNSRPLIKSDTFGTKVKTYITWDDRENQTYSTEVTNSTRGTVYKYKYSSTSHGGNPDDFFMELSPDKHTPVLLNLNLGYGNARLDLSDLAVKSLNIVSGTADILISYKKLNRVAMNDLIIKGGMSQIVLRNLELARAGNVRVENGMGNTKILLGNSCQKQSNLDLEVGAGNCILMVEENVPLKVIVTGTFFSTVELPDNFVETGENEYVNLAFKEFPGHAHNVYVDVGIGSFKIITFQ